MWLECQFPSADLYNPCVAHRPLVSHTGSKAEKLARIVMLISYEYSSQVIKRSCLWSTFSCSFTFSFLVSVRYQVRRVKIYGNAAKSRAVSSRNMYRTLDLIASLIWRCLCHPKVLSQLSISFHLYFSKFSSFHLPKSVLSRPAGSK